MEESFGTPWTKLDHPVPEEEIEWVDKYWRAANYMSVGQIYLRSNPLMRKDWVDEKTGQVRDFGRADVKYRLVGHWGTTSGINFLMGHVNRLIHDHGQNTVFLMGPGHGGPAGTSQSILDGTYRERYPFITDDEVGLEKFFRRFSYPGGIPSHFAPETPVRSMREASSAIRFPMLMELCFPIRPCSQLLSSAMARQRQALLPPLGKPISS